MLYKLLQEMIVMNEDLYNIRRMFGIAKHHLPNCVTCHRSLTQDTTKYVSKNVP